MRRRLALALGSLALAAAGACGNDETLVSPLPVDAGPDVVDAAPPDVAAPEAQAAKRTIITRNPYGDVAAGDNLLWDGDFEWDTAFADSYGWVGAGTFFVPIGTFDQIHIGYACHSGMKCGWIGSGESIGAIGVAPGHAAIDASVWIKPPAKACGDVGVFLIGCTERTEADVPLLDDDGKPDADGWCRFHVVAPEREKATCMLVESRFSEGEAVVDDAVVRAAPAGAKALRSLAVLAARDREAVASMQQSIARALEPRTPPPNAAASAFARWQRGSR